MTLLTHSNPPATFEIIVLLIPRSQMPNLDFGRKSLFCASSEQLSKPGFEPSETAFFATSRRARLLAQCQLPNTIQSLITYKALSTSYLLNAAEHSHGRRVGRMPAVMELFTIKGGLKTAPTATYGIHVRQ